MRMREDSEKEEVTNPPEMKSPSLMVGSSIDSKISIKKNERLIEERLLVNMKIQKIDDVEVIRSLMEIIVKAQKTL